MARISARGCGRRVSCGMGRAASFVGTHHGRLAASSNLFRAARGRARWRGSARPGSAGTRRRASGAEDRLPGCRSPRAALVAAPRRYGFHATLKPPFRLAEGADAAGLDAAAARGGGGFAPFALRLRLGWLGGFLALVPEAAPPELAALAAACVTRARRLPGAAGAAELARRRAAGLDAVEAENLRRWGYPYVLDRFRFHMTLTGPVPAGRGRRWRRRSRRSLAPLGRRADAGRRGLPVRRGRGRVVPARSGGIRLGRRPRRARSARSASGAVKRIASMPRAAAPATLAALSSMKTQAPASRPLRSRQRR